MINRTLKETISRHIKDNKAVIILGARQTGKTTLLKSIASELTDVMWLNADEPDILELFENATSTRLRAYFANYSYIFIDEAQRIKDVGIKLKLITDQLPEKKLFVSGSSAFELANQINEPLTGRKWEYHLFPVSFQELSNHNGLLEERRMLPHRLVFGCYPEVVENVGREKNILKQISDSYLYKDILNWQGLKKPEKLLKLLQALALQVGSEISYNELGKIVDLDNETVEKYIQLLEKTYVIFRLTAFSRNLRKELKRSRKIYFYDNGIRNALIANFSAIELRTDIGALWENFVLSERLKFTSYNQIWANRYFWRTQDQMEIDYIEERDGKIYAFEFKWNRKAKVRFSKSFLKAYPENETQIITPENYFDFISDPN
jgi:predicted AAA+ superfamily ATPase